MRAIVTFQGFTESASRRTGTEDLYWEVVRKFSSNDITTDWPRRWTADVKELAAMLARQGIRNVAMVSYSHGQAAACDFAGHCYGLGIEVDLWVACDPIFRPSWLPRLNLFQPFAFRSLAGKARIRVPHNVKRVASVFQRVNRPNGHELVAKNAATVMRNPIQLPFGHTDIDSSGEWFALVNEELGMWANKPK